MVRGLSGCTLVVASLLAGPAQARAQAPQPLASALQWVTRAEPAPTGATPEQAARYHLKRAGLGRLAPAAVDAARLLFVHDTGRGGIIVALRQTVDGIDLVRSDIKVLLDRSHQLRAIVGGLHPSAAAPAAALASFSTPAAQVAAVAVALRDRYGIELGAYLGRSSEPPRAGHSYLDLAVPGPVDLQLRRPARIKPVYYPLGATLVAAHRVEIQASRARGGGPSEALAWIVATDGRILERRDLTAHQSFNYRVFADPDGRPLDGPLTDYTPHPTGKPEGGPTEGVAPTLVTMDGFNTNPGGEADPWLAPGATETRGNNVDAYADHTNPTGLTLMLGDFRAAVSAPGVFDYSYDITHEPLATKDQSMAAIVSLFYVSNWMHDWWYDSGFTEGAGNAQQSNFGRGGVEDDPIRAEGQDDVFAGARDNANMQTPEDGESPIMQMYLWGPSHKELHFTADPPGQEFKVGQATFGPRTYDLTALLVLVDDGMGKSPTDGCEPPLNDLTGKIALIDRGTCSFEAKATFAQAAGALGVVFPDSLANMGAYPPGPPDINLPDPTIPGQGLSKADGILLKEALLNGPVTGHMVGNTSVERDGTIDNLIVAHEWGHMLHQRLVDCGSVQCGGQSEGWGDFNALMMALRDGDDLDATYAVAYYGPNDPNAYYGLRRIPYTVNQSKNGLSFRHISEGEPLPPELLDNGITNAESHNAGEVWSTMMWEAYVGLHKAHLGDSFESTHRRMSDYVVAGMMMAPTSPTFTDQRDGLLAAAFEASQDDFFTLAQAFARRGAGTCAVAPARNSFDLVGVVEDFELHPNGMLLAATLDDTAVSCDQDGLLDPGETGHITVKVQNAGDVPMVGATVKVSVANTSLKFTQDTLAVPELAAHTQTDITFEVTLTDELADAPQADVLSLELTTPDGCEAVTQLPLLAIFDADLAKATSKTDDVETGVIVWSAVQPPGSDVWSPAMRPDGHVWHANNLAYQSDSRLVSPALVVAPDQPFTLTFEHLHEFSAFVPDDPMQPPYFFDAAVIELTVDAGLTWTDISEFTDAPGYNGALKNPNNPIGVDRQAFVGKNPSYPDADTVALDFGTAFAGQTVQLRFRIGTDFNGGAPGWDIDNIAFTGITNTPFAAFIGDAGACDPDMPTTDTPTTSGGDGGVSESATDGPTTTAGSSSDGSSSSDGPAETGDDGCGCKASTRGSLLPLLALLALPRRRRRPITR